jgi:hypothetical protein
MDSEIISRCNQVIRMLDGESQEISLGFKGELFDSYMGLIKLETECMMSIREQLYKVFDV